MHAGLVSDQVRSLARPVCTSVNCWRLHNVYLRKRSMEIAVRAVGYLEACKCHDWDSNTHSDNLGPCRTRVCFVRPKET